MVKLGNIFKYPRYISIDLNKPVSVAKSAFGIATGIGVGEFVSATVVSAFGLTGKKKFAVSAITKALTGLVFFLAMPYVGPLASWFGLMGIGCVVGIVSDIIRSLISPETKGHTLGMMIGRKIESMRYGGSAVAESMRSAVVEARPYKEEKEKIEVKLGEEKREKEIKIGGFV